MQVKVDNFKTVKTRPDWVFNQGAQCAMKVTKEGHATRIYTDKYNSVEEAIDLFEKCETFRHKDIN